MLHNTTPSCDQLRIFGYLCFATVTKPNKDKFSLKALKSVFLGYCHDHKGYKLFDLDTKQLVVSHDVVFHEHIFPFQTSTPSQTPDTTLPPVPDTEDITDNILNHPILDTSPHSSDQTSLDSAPLTIATSPLPDTCPRPLRHSTHHVQKLAWMSDFICNHHSTFSTAHLHFVPQLSVLQEPRSYSQAKGRAEWEVAMKEEIQALEKSNTWSLTSLPDGKRAIGSRWVYKLKLNPDGSVSRYKARLVAKGYTQIEGVDYTESFSPVAKNVTVRLFLSIAAAYSWPVHQLDINNAFLHGHLDEEVYMTPPEGYLVQPGMVCRLHKSLYGLKQASRQWNHEFTQTLGDFGFRQSAHDHCPFIKSTSTGFLGLLVYVDDILIMGPAEALIIEVKNYLNALFTIKDLGYAKYFLGLEIARSSDGMSVTQRKYINDIIIDTGMTDAHSVLTPLPHGVKFSSELGAPLSDPEKYRRLIGR
ncbi:UNVERIFIED_CONTAM: Retrovirus-related Pol polyprotein from transposon RE1 [Sesamum angustifolium]|uniref:Retrovirus-related Pol polyprotein from transposon RE1 n=1 Tax=Sesamum angustifolium TaxID=2727405 RepID=A0AAW2IQ61_9LAMI